MAGNKYPRELPTQAAKPFPGTGRGFGRGYVSNQCPGTSAPVTKTTTLPPPGFTVFRAAPGETPKQQPPPGYVPFRQALANANQPLREIEEREKLAKSYIPGLHIPGQNFPMLPDPPSNAVNRLEIPPELVREYRGRSKHPVSAMEEFSKKLKIEVIFKETPLDITNICNYGMFGNTCFVDGRQYPQGSGKTKKEAKTAAAKNAFDAILRDGFSIIKESDKDDSCNDDSSVASVQTSELSAPQLSTAQKNAAAIFNEFCQKKNIEPKISISDQPLQHGFECVITSQGQLLGRAYANNKKDAKNRACDEALRTLMGKTSDASTASHFDQMASLVKQKLGQLQKEYPIDISDYGVLAGFVIKQFKNDEGRVVALATGNGCLRNLASAVHGKVVVDCHAEVLAKRALQKWFTRQLSEANDSIRRRVPNNSIFEMNGNGDKFQLKENVSIHFYISAAPCGDASALPVDTVPFITPEEQAAIFSGTHNPKFEREEHGCLRAKGERGAITVKVSQIPSKTSQEEMEYEVKFQTMSCSDKILKWNVLGLQGSMLSHLVEPIYINSITIGRNFEFGDMTRAMCCRVADEIGADLPPGYHLCHPLIGRVSVYEPSPSVAAQAGNQCINWSASDQDVEILNYINGRSLPESPFHTQADPTASRLCKFGFNVRFCNLAKALDRLDLYNHATYGQLKTSAAEYNSAKETLYAYMEASAYGSWLKEPYNLDNFSVK